MSRPLLYTLVFRKISMLFHEIMFMVVSLRFFTSATIETGVKLWVTKSRDKARGVYARWTTDYKPLNKYTMKFVSDLCFSSKKKKSSYLILMQPSLHKTLAHFEWSLWCQSSHQTRASIHFLLLWYLNLHKQCKSSSLSRGKHIP